MDYEQARALINEHAFRVENSVGIVAQNGDPNAKKLKNRTWLVTGSNGYYLELFGKRIIYWKKELFDLQDHGFFSRTTHDRFNEYMPRGFRVHGVTYPFLRKVWGPVGLVTTPKGTYPYAMPMSFKYDGYSADWGGLCNTIPAVLARLPRYIDRHVDALLKGPPFPSSEFGAFATFDGDKYVVSRRMGLAIEQNHYGRTLLMMACRESEKQVGGLDLTTCEKLLREDGYNIFADNKTKAGLASRMETALSIGRVPHIKYATLRSTLRNCLIEFVMEKLGFDRVEWHRR